MSHGQNIHPELQTLTAFAVGDLTENEAKDVEVHIAECETCCETLLNLENDTFVDLVVRSKDVQIESHEQTEDIHGSSTATPVVSDELDLLSELASHPRYRTVELLGRGGMGDVLKAEHRMMERTVALKVIKRELFRNPAAVQRFHREVKSATRLSHPNIVTAHDAEQAGDVNFLVMEYVEGVDLARRVKEEGALPINEACQYILQTALGLQHAHEQGMVHRDIKPHNLMVTGDGTLKILDFGLATFATEANTYEGGDNPSVDVPEKTSTSRLTTMGTMMGTPEFISPEQAGEPHAVDIRSDIYSLGCTFYYLLSGHAPFVDGSVMEKVKAHADQQAEPIQNVRDDVPSDVAEVVRRTMAKNPAERFQTPAEVADALAPFVDAHRTTPMSKHEADPAASTGWSRRSWWPPTVVQSIVCAAFAFVLAGVIYIATDNGTLEVVSDDENVEIIVRGGDGLRIVDTVTGSAAKRLRSGEYSVDLKGNGNDFELNKDRFVLKRGGKVIVRVSRKRSDVAAPVIRVSGAHGHQNIEQSITERKRWSTEKFIGVGSISTDGRYLPFVDQKEGNVEIRDLAAGRSWFVADQTKDGRKGGRFAHSEAPPIISADGKRVVFNWYEHLKSQEEGSYRLRVSNLDGSQASDLYQNNEVWPQPFDWSADSESILASFHLTDDTSQIVLVSAEDGSVRIVKSLDWRGVSNMKFSRSNQSIVYDRDVRTRRNGPPNHDIYLLDHERNIEMTLVEHPADDRLLGWSADRGTILFSSDRRGTLDLWSIDVADPGKPSLVKEGIGSIDPIGFATDDTFYYRRSLGGEDVYVATVDFESGELKTPPRKVSRFREGENIAPNWSPDGQQLAYVRVRNRPRITILTTETEEYRELYPDLRYMRAKGARWSPDGKSFVLDGTDHKGRRGIYLVDSQSGDTELVRRDPETVGRRPEWIPDGQSIVFVAVHPRASPGQAPFAIRVRNLATGEEKDIVADINSRQEPSIALSPDGHTLAFVTRDKQASKLNLVSLSGGDPRTVYQVKKQKLGQIEWAHDGSHIIVECTGGKDTELWRVSIKDGSSSPLGLSAEGIYNGMLLPRIHRDGRQVAFTAASVDGKKEATSEVWTLKNFLPPLDEKQVASISAQSKPRPVAPTVRQVWAEPIDTQGSPSPDGRWLTFTDWPTRELAIRDLETGENHRLKTPWSQEGGFPYFHVWSPDGTRIAMSWADANSNYNHLRIVGRDGSEPREIYHDDEFPYILPVAWSTSDEILAIQQRSDRTTRFVLVSVADGSLRTLHSLGWDWPLHASLSPDGRYVVYDLLQKEGSPHRDIFLLAVNGDFQRTVVANAAHDYAPVWMPDGKRIVFTSNRNGSVNLWALSVEDGKPSGSPRQLPIDMNRMLPMGMSRDGTYYYRDTQFSTASDIYVASFDPKTGNVLDAPTKASQQHEGFNSRPCWSPDGMRLAFESMRGPLIHVYSSPVPVVRDMATDDEHVLPMHERLRLRAWSPDGKSILLSGTNAKRQRGVYTMNVESEHLSFLFRPNFRRQDAAWSPDGNLVFYIDGIPNSAFGIFSWTQATGEKKLLCNFWKADEADLKRKGPQSLAVSPDGKRIAFSTKKELRLMATNGGESQVLAREADSLEIPSMVGIVWTPDGKSLIYGEGRNPGEGADASDQSTQLWIIDVAGLERRPLGSPIVGLSDISLHPEGNKIAYTVSSKSEDSTVKGIWALENFLPPLNGAN